ncbi:MAG: hypothetical protein ABI885_00175 [Gammaproteobacteria bacterium]
MHSILHLEELPRVRHDFSVSRMIERFHRQDTRSKFLIMVFNVLDEFVLRVCWPDDEHFTGAGDGRHDPVKEWLIFCRVTASD